MKYLLELYDIMVNETVEFITSSALVAHDWLPDSGVLEFDFGVGYPKIEPKSFFIGW